MPKKIIHSNQAGFSIVEIVVGLVLIGIVIISITDIFIATAAIQRQNRNLSLASRAGEQKIESLRNNHYNTLVNSPPDIDFTSELPTELGEPRSAIVTISEPEQGIKRLDIVITYKEGSRDKTIRFSSLIGNIGISQ